ncbi:hypothetical protein KIN20_032766, partial [Parelaphostrongylus tenuis]
VREKLQKTSRPYQICLEIYDTEVSYVNALSLLLNVKDELEKHADSGDSLIEKSEVAFILGKVSPIVSFHKDVITRLKEKLDNWKSGAEIAHASFLNF